MIRCKRRYIVSLLTAFGQISLTIDTSLGIPGAVKKAKWYAISHHFADGYEIKVLAVHEIK